MPSPLLSAQITSTRIRGGGHDDLPALARLVARANRVIGAPHIELDELDDRLELGQLIVLELQPNELVAAACTASHRGVVFLVIDPEVASPELEHRMIGVANALCESALPPRLADRS